MLTRAKKKDETSLRCCLSFAFASGSTGQDCGHHHERQQPQPSLEYGSYRSPIPPQELSTTVSLSLTSPRFEARQPAPSMHARIPQTATPRPIFDSCEDQRSTISQVTANFLSKKKSVTRSPKPRTNSRQSSVFLRYKQQARSVRSRQLLLSPNLPHSATLTRSFCAAHLASWDHQLLHRQEHCPVNLNFSLWETIQQTDTEKKLA